MRRNEDNGLHLSVQKYLSGIKHKTDLYIYMKTEEERGMKGRRRDKGVEREEGERGGGRREGERELRE
jgi:hypothetical protein